MADEFQGMAVPEGAPDGLAQAATGFASVAASTAVAATRLDSMPAQTGSWIGQASVAHASMCMTNASAARQAGEAATIVTLAAERYAKDLQVARRRARIAIRDAREAQERIDRAKEQIADAQGRAADASRRIEWANHALMASSMGGEPSPVAEAELAAAGRDLDKAQEDEQRARRQLERAEDDLDQAKQRWREADQDAKDAAKAAAGGFAQAAAMLPNFVTPPPPPPPPEPEEDKPWWQDAAGWTGDQFVGFGKGAWEGVKGIGSAGAMIYRASPVNALVNTDSFTNQWNQLGQGAKYAWDNPGEFAKQVVNAEDLANGRIGEWLGGLAPDAALAAVTAGSGVAVTRGARVANVIEKGTPPPSTVLKVGGRNPINSRYAGQKFPLGDDLAAKYPKGVTFRETGFPEFTRYREGHAVIDGLTGRIGTDERMANKAVGLDDTPEGWTWHHVEDGRTMELIPSDLHGAVRHTGGAATIRHGQIGEIPIVKVPRAWSWGTGAGAGLGSAGLSEAPALVGGP
jgi:A nuclease of the HNH/ENDO VII superfamily with conserved WHH